MNGQDCSRYWGIPLRALSEKINTQYYEPVLQLTGRIRVHQGQLKTKGLPDIDQPYMSLSSRLLDEIDAYIENRKQVFIPYIAQLSAKNGDNMIPGPDAAHEMMLNRFTRSLQETKEVFYDLKTEMIWAYGARNISLKVLRDQIMILTALLDNLFVVEEDCLLSQLRSVQGGIAPMKKTG